MSDDQGWSLDPEEGKRRLQEEMEKGADKRVERAWTLLRDALREADIALVYARDAELQKVRIALKAALDERTRDKIYAQANKLVRGGKTDRRHGSWKRDGELFLSVILAEWDATDERLARRVIGHIPDLQMLPVRDFVFNEADVPRVAAVISKFERHAADSPKHRDKTAKTIAREILRVYNADPADVQDVFE